MDKKHVVFIVNPKSGTERKKEIQDAVEASLDMGAYSYEILTTEFAKHGTALAKEAARNGAWAVIAVGGDGSVNDIVQGLLGTNCIMGIIPKGSGNGMARSMGIPLTPADAVRVINKGHILDIDVGFANGKAFISNAGVAFDALIAKKFAKSTRRGLMVYSWLVTKHMWLYKEWDWQINIDGKELNEKAFMVIVANGKQFGYNFKIAPMASYTDGMLDVIVVRKFPKILGGLIVLRALNGTIANSPYVKHYKGRDITITHPSMRLMQTDGDASPSENKIRFTIQHHAQQMLVP
jgi:diacylglycerol kinase (ATP)